MKGDVVVVKVVPGETVEAGQVPFKASTPENFLPQPKNPCQYSSSSPEVVAVLSAMKMEMAVQAPIGGKVGTGTVDGTVGQWTDLWLQVKATHVVVGDKVDAEDLLVELE